MKLKKVIVLKIAKETPYFSTFFITSKLGNVEIVGLLEEKDPVCGSVQVLLPGQRLEGVSDLSVLLLHRIIEHNRLDARPLQAGPLEQGEGVDGVGDIVLGFLLAVAVVLKRKRNSYSFDTSLCIALPRTILIWVPLNRYIVSDFHVSCRVNECNGKSVFLFCRKRPFQITKPYLVSVVQ